MHRIPCVRTPELPPMSGDPLATRLVLPHPAPDLIQRQALLRRLTDAVGRPLTLVAAPAGAGKTSLRARGRGRGSRPAPWRGSRWTASG